MKKYEDCAWCQAVKDLKTERGSINGKTLCTDCGIDLTYRCSACMEQHKEEECELPPDDVCCCGDSMKGHANPMECGHMPVSQRAHYLWLSQEAQPKPENEE